LPGTARKILPGGHLARGQKEDIVRGHPRRSISGEGKKEIARKTF
jgi:hypothetical protein